MLTTYELRVLYLLRKHGGRAKHSQISQAMHRFDPDDRKAALSNLETLELISSAKTPPVKGKGGPGGLVYWLTSEGIEHVQGMINAGELPDPDKEPRAGKKGDKRASD